MEARNQRNFAPEEFVGAIDSRCLSGVLTSGQALSMVREQEKTRKERIQLALNNKAVPALQHISRMVRTL